jgi:eukaryotic-like serine/threonine-protein kinase
MNHYPMLPSGASLAQFRIVSRLGAGGMGEVYLAEDTRLGRRVALKILPAEVTRDPERSAPGTLRLLQEAKAASVLNHANVATVYEIGEAEGVSFIAMEYVEGEPLTIRIAGHPLEAPEIVRLGIQAADALDEAHSKGVTHRDIKPANIMITPKGQVKVLDFGLAKINAPGAQNGATENLTQPGMVMGTAKYMSPEQALGRSVDHRTDIFSLGVVLYEMATGRLPFEGATAPQTLDRILHAPPEPISRISPELERIVRKCLEKDRERRYQSARELRVDLRNLERDSDSVTAAPPPPGISKKHHWSGLRYTVTGVAIVLVLGSLLLLHQGDRADVIESIAVLPFVNGTGNPDTDYLSDGITDSLINSLAQLPKLRVTARSLVFRYKGKDPDPQKAGRDLKVRAVMTGRVVQRGDSLGIQTELMDVDAGTQLWGQQYNRKLADVLAVQEEIAKEISEKLRLRLTGEEQKRLTKRYTENVEAYQAYLRGRYHLYRYTADGVKRGIEFLNRAIELEPNYAPAYAGLAEAYSLHAGSFLVSSEALPKAWSAAAKALELDDGLAEAHNALGMVKYLFEWDWTGAEREYQRAIEQNPNYATAHDQYGFYLVLMGRNEEGHREVKRAVELDPLSPAFQADLGEVFRFARRPDQAIEQYQKSIQMDPNFWLAHTLLGFVYGDKGNFSAAFAAVEKARSMEDDPQVLLTEAHLLARSGQAARARTLLREVEERSRRSPVPVPFIALVYGDLGDKDQAFKWLEKGFQERVWMLFLKADPNFDPLRSDTRFAEILRRMGLPR